MPDPSQTTARNDSSTLRQLWLNYRRKRFWAVVGLVLYACSGFFLAPVLVKHLALKNIEAVTKRSASIAAVRINPFVLSLEADGFELEDSDGERLVAVEGLRANFQLSSLFRRAWTFRELRLDGPYVLYERFSPGDGRFSRLAADMESPEPAAQTPAEAPPRLLVHELLINEGKLRFRDHVPGETVDQSAGPVTVTVHGLNTLPERDGLHDVQIGLGNGASLAWHGDFGLHPLRSSGSFSLRDLALDPLLPYLKSAYPLDALSARFSLQTDYALGFDEGQLSLQLNGLESRLADASVSGLSPTTDFLAFEALEISGGALNYPENRVEIGSIHLLEPNADIWLDEDGQAGLAQLAPESEPVDNDSAPTETWSISVGEFRVEGGRAALQDRSVEPNASLQVENMAFRLTGVDNRENTPMPVSLGLDLAGGGNAVFEGELVVLPAVSLDGNLRIDSVPLAIAQPYVQQRMALAIGSGDLLGSMQLALDETGGISAAGEMSVPGLELTDTVENLPLLAWENMVIDRFEADTTGATAHLSSIRFTKPFGRIEIREDLSTNLDGLSGDTDAAAPAEEPESNWNFVIGGVAVDDGSLAFSDLSLPLPFATNISGLGGTVSTIDSASARPAEIRLEGQVDEYGMARIGGSMNLLDPVAHTDVEMEFRNLEMTRLSPYTVQFAGHEIAAGKLDLDLAYGIVDGRLDGRNDIVLSDLELGGKVDHPDAASLPLGLAVALLKDSRGVIDIDLPVSGDVNDPEFRIGGVIWKAFAGLITKVVAAPFKLLGNLIGVDSEDFGQFQFLTGRSDLTPPELEEVAQLREALLQRPELAVEINGVYDPAKDRRALQFFRLRETVWTRLGRNPAEQGGGDEMLDQEVLGVYESLYSESFPDSPLAELKAAHSAPPADDPEGAPVLDSTAYSGALRDRLVDAEPVGKAELETLADQRAQVVYEAFLEDGSLDEDRVRMGESAPVDLGEGEWVVMELGVAIE